MAKFTNGLIKLLQRDWQQAVSKRVNTDERGMVLVVVMVLATISLAFTAATIYSVTTGSQMTGAQQRYQTAVDASRAGGDIMQKVLDDRNTLDLPVSVNVLAEGRVPAAIAGFATDCLDAKLNNDGNLWDAACNANPLIDTVNANTYDLTFDLGSGTILDPVYNVYGKVVDTVDGNSAANLGLTKPGVVLSNTGEITPMSLPFLYTVEVLAENSVNLTERARLSFLYQF